MIWHDSSAHRWMVEDVALSGFDCLGEGCCVIRFYEVNLTDCRRVVRDALILNTELFGLV